MRENEIKKNPIIYVDMDGVLADFDGQYREWFDKDPAGSSKDDPNIHKIVGTDFFGTLNKLPEADKVIDLAKQYGNGSYSICSSPLRYDNKNSAEWKRVWLNKHYSNNPPQRTIFTGRKESFAVSNGQWNVLIDDKPRNIDAWNSRGGKGILYDAYKDSIEYHKNELKKIFSANLSESKDYHQHFKMMFRNFLDVAIEVLELENLPEFNFENFLDHPDQPTFGMYVNGENKLYVGLSGRHPNDILRTIAHELVHFKQDSEHRLDNNSGDTGSPEENEAHAKAGIIMRIYNQRYPQSLKSKPLM